MTDILLQSILISFFCVGLRLVSGKGMILYFLRKPYEILGDMKGEIAENKPDQGISYLVVAMLHLFLKPIIGCVTCMSGVWTLVSSSIFFQGINKTSILIIFVVSFLNTFLFSLCQKIEK